MTRRFDAIEWVRVAAACGVVWYHIKDGPFKALGHGGLVCFVLISVVFLAMGSEKAAFGSYLGKRVERILPPWLFWLAFYGIFNLVKGKEFLPSSENVAAGILSGTWVGLWYLPFILLISPLVFGLATATAGLHSAARAAGFFLIGIVILFSSPQVGASWKSLEPWGQWHHALASIPLGLAMHAVLKTSGKTRVILMGTLVIVAEAVCTWMMLIDSATAVPYAVGIPLVGLGFLVPSGLPTAVTKLGGLCLGVYVMHSAVLSFLKLVPVVGHSPLLLWVGAVAVTFAATALMRKNRWLAKVV